MKAWIKKNKSHIINWAVFLIGTLACCFCRLTFNMFFTAFIFPACFLFFSRREKACISLPVIYAGSVLGCGISAWKIVIAAGVGLEIALAFVLGLITLIPFLLDKLVFSRFYKKHTFILSLLFPLTWITIDVICGFTPIGGYISIGYTLCQIIQVTSVISLFGLNFLSFIIIYFSSAIVNFVLDYKHNFKAMIMNGSLILFSLCYSGVYNVVPTNNTTSIKVMTGYSTNDSNLFERTKLSLEENKQWLDIDVALAKQSNALMLVYPEESFWLFSDNQEDIQFKQYLSEVADTNDIYIVSGIQIWANKDSTSHHKNLAWVADPNGNILEYQKTHLVPVEEEGYDKGNGEILTFNINGICKVGVVICMDLEFPAFISKAGRLGCDVLIAPSWDWPTMPSNHSISTCYRAIENGFNFLRVTEAGNSIACDYKGNVITQYYTDCNYENKNHNNHIFDLPTKSIKTAYSYLAPGIDFVYPFSLIVLLVVFGILENKKFKNKSKK